MSMLLLEQVELFRSLNDRSDIPINRPVVSVIGCSRAVSVGWK